MRRAAATLCLIGLSAAGLIGAPEPFRDPKLPIEARVNNLVSLLTLAEKIGLLGQNAPAIARLNIKAFTNWTEGLHGIGWARGGNLTATQFPQSVGLGETWDTELLRQVGAVEGYEARVYFQKFEGTRVGLAVRAPNVDLTRDPRWGRAEESFGEDPFHVGTMSAAFIRGMQGDNPKYILAASTMKHFLANSNEDDRTRSSSDFDERNLREYYIVPFQMGVKDANAQSYMAAYNATNKVPMTVHPIMRDIVEKEWRFDGMVCTDSGSLPNLTREFHYYPDATEAAAGAVKAGITVFLDRYADSVKAALDKGLITEADIERNVKGNLRMRMRLGEFDPPEMVPYNKISGSEEPWFGDKHKALALKATQESIVLLKNTNGLLPLDKHAIKSIAVIGAAANDVFIDWYAGNLPYAVTPLDGIRAKVGPGVRVRYALDNQINSNAANIAAESDLAIVFIGNIPTCNAPFGKGCPPSEGKEALDRKTIELEPAQTQMVQRVMRANPKTIVVLVSSFPYSMSAVQQAAPAILHMSHSSQEQGAALADVLFGDYNPGGRLSVTWPKSVNDLPPMMDYDIRKGRTYMYSKAEPQYPFGYGLSYTTFEYANLRTSADTIRAGGELVVRVDVKNTGSRMGDEVPQLYVSYPGSAVERPIRQLRGFTRVSLKPGETRTVELKLKAADLTYWNAASHAFTLEPGNVDVQIGASSADIRLNKTILVGK
jgi:beta-glucosidase